jgi:putative spermidine/putrescine transport system permease protein
MTTIAAQSPTSARARRQRPHLDGAVAMVVPGLLFMALAFAVPVLNLIGDSLSDTGGFTLGGYRKVLGDPYYVGIIGNSLQLGLVTTLGTLIIGYPAAYALARAPPRLQVILFALIFLPLTVSIIVKTFGLTIMMRRDGIINWLLVNLGFIERPMRLVFTEFSLYFGMINVFLPFMILPIYSVMRQLDPRLGDAAASLGAGPVMTFFKVTLPLTMPGVVAGASLVFSIAVAAYVTPGLLIGDRFMTMSQVMAKAYLNIRDFNLGASMAVIMLMIAAAIVLLSTYLARAVSDRGGRGT